MTSANAVPAVTLGDELSVSAIGFGAMVLTPVYGEVDDTESLATLHHAVDLGVTFIDTANQYGGGANEQLISKLLADRRDEVTLATKFGIVGTRRLTVLQANSSLVVMPHTCIRASMRACSGCRPTSSTSTTCTAAT